MQTVSINSLSEFVAQKNSQQPQQQTTSSTPLHLQGLQTPTNLTTTPVTPQTVTESATTQLDNLNKLLESVAKIISSPIVEKIMGNKFGGENKAVFEAATNNAQPQPAPHPTAQLPQIPAGEISINPDAGSKKIHLFVSTMLSEIEKKNPTQTVKELLDEWNSQETILKQQLNKFIFNQSESNGSE